MRVRVDQAGDHRFTAKIDSARAGPGEPRDVLVRPDRHETIASDRHRLRDRKSVVHGDDLAVCENHVDTRLLCMDDDGSRDRQQCTGRQ